MAATNMNQQQQLGQAQPSVAEVQKVLNRRGDTTLIQKPLVVAEGGLPVLQQDLLEVLGQSTTHSYTLCVDGDACCSCRRRRRGRAR